MLRIRTAKRCGVIQASSEAAVRRAAEASIGRRPAAVTPMRAGPGRAVMIVAKAPDSKTSGKASDRTDPRTSGGAVPPHGRAAGEDR